MTVYAKEEAFAFLAKHQTLPTVVVDLAKKDEFGVLPGKIKVRDKAGRLYHADVRIYDDNPCPTINMRPLGLSAEHGYSDIVELAHYANSPTVDVDSSLVLVLVNSDRRTAAVLELPVIAGSNFGSFLFSDYRLANRPVFTDQMDELLGKMNKIR